MKFHLGQRVRVVKQGIRYKGHNHLGKTGEVREVSEYGYHVLLDGTSGKEATFFEDELEAVEKG